MRSLPLLLILVMAVGGFTYFGNETVRTLPKAGQYDRYFPTPQTSVNTATHLLQTSDWSTLATYYDLSAGNVDVEALTTGAYFFAKADPATDASETAPIRLVNPFELGARYLSAIPLADDEIEVTVVFDAVEPNDEQTNTFHLKAHPEGYKLIATQ